MNCFPSWVPSWVPSCIQFGKFANLELSATRDYVYVSSIFGQRIESVDCPLNLSKDSPYWRGKEFLDHGNIDYGRWLSELKNGQVIHQEYYHEPEKTDGPLDLSKTNAESQPVSVEERPEPIRTVDEVPHGIPIYRRRILHCHLCSFTTNHKNNLRKHVTGRHMEAENVVCPKCGKVSKHRYSLSVHLHYCGKEPRFYCAYCPNKYLKRDHLQRHVLRNHVDKPVMKGPSPYSSECSSPTSSVDENTAPSSIEMTKVIEKQAKDDAKGDTKASIECPRCGRGFEYYGHMQRHYKSCSGNSIQCKLCPYKAKDSEMLRIHVFNVHENIDFADLAVLGGITVKTEPV